MLNFCTVRFVPSGVCSFELLPKARDPRHAHLSVRAALDVFDVEIEGLIFVTHRMPNALWGAAVR